MTTLSTNANLEDLVHQRGPNRGELNIDAYLAEIQRLNNSTNEQNEARYGELLEELRTGTSEARNIISRGSTAALAQIDRTAAARRERIARDSARRTASDENSLISRGLGNTTVVDSIRNINREREDLTYNELESNLAQLRAGIIQGGAQQEAGVVERGSQNVASAIEARQDIGPDLGAAFSLVQQIADARAEREAAAEERDNLEESEAAGRRSAVDINLSRARQRANHPHAGAGASSDFHRFYTTRNRYL